MHYSTLALDGGGEQSASHPGHFTPRERDPCIHWIKGWVGPRASLDMVSKRKIPSLWPGIEPQSSDHPQPIAGWYTDSYSSSYKFQSYN
jgi:hypothetical protein